MQFEPCGHRVLIYPDVVDERTAGGIILAETTKQRDQQATMRGTIVAVGINAWKAFDDGTPWAKVGDRVVFRRYAGEIVKDGDKEYRVVNDEDCLCVLRDTLCEASLVAGMEELMRNKDAYVVNATKQEG